MKILRLAAWIVCAAMTVSAATPSRAQQQQKFNLFLCNISANPAQFALTVQISPKQWRVRGWFVLPSQQCQVTGTYLKPAFYFWGIDSEDAVWQADDDDNTGVNECIFKEGFDYEPGKFRSCELSGKFKRVDVPADADNVTFTFK